MNLESQIKQLYTQSLPGKYEKMQKHMLRYKKIAVEKSSLKLDDSVVVFCCGSGMDFEGIENRIGPKGRIVGVDFSDEMLNLASKKIGQYGWHNITLVNDDVTKCDFSKNLNTPYDVGICTLGISIIPQYEQAYRNLISCIKSGGELVIGDMQLASGFLSIFNPLSILLSKPFGGSRLGHQNSRKLYFIMKEELSDLRKEEYMFKSYFIAWGTKR